MDDKTVLKPFPYLSDEECEILGKFLAPYLAWVMFRLTYKTLLAFNEND